MTSATTSSVIREVFGRLPGSAVVERVRLRTPDGFEARIITYGAALQALFVPDRHGEVGDVVLGHDDLASYAAARRFFGATVGRYANRIAGAGFTLDGERISLDANNGPNALHGGLQGFDRRLWTITAVDDGPAPAVTLAYRSLHGEEGYPGTLDVSATYRISAPRELSIEHTATTDRPTVVNLTNHSFFNLDGAASTSDILSHRLTVAADAFLATDETAIPLHELPRSVTGTPFDFREANEIGARIRQNDEQLRRGRGYDHNFCLSPDAGLRFAARIEAPRSGRVMELHTNQPGLQVYSGNYLDGSVPGKHGRLYRQSDALCLEPQAWPDTPNRSDFPSVLLQPGEVYRHHALYRFSAA
ncbi:aldose epimerase family protein [Bradyrhizobium prioriisuperbiae]|uniref:aldose epimerase family protein n=1 Tax=Bradyrhizobium prioriisuperbiae TaxID=2854389 RepID=UPI0028EA2C8E|nr:aldose epimerase family protein [Bradyrhizobium prioritasuperba]